MNKYSFQSLSYSNFSRLWTHRMGWGTLSVMKGKLVFECFLGTMVVPRKDACIRVLDDRNIRVFNKEYEFFYVRSREISDLLGCLEENGYRTIDVGMCKKPVAFLLRDFTKALLCLIAGGAAAAVVYLVLFFFDLI